MYSFSANVEMGVWRDKNGYDNEQINGWGKLESFISDRKDEE